MNTYKTSCGERVNQAYVDSKIRQAKRQKKEQFISKHNYLFCEDCGHNGTFYRLDMSHDVSIKKAKESGKTELCWDVKNITIRCRKCHQKYDKLNTQFK